MRERTFYPIYLRDFVAVSSLSNGLGNQFQSTFKKSHLTENALHKEHNAYICLLK